jgi:hypothetical protein
MWGSPNCDFAHHKGQRYCRHHHCVEVDAECHQPDRRSPSARAIARMQGGVDGNSTMRGERVSRRLFLTRGAALGAATAAVGPVGSADARTIHGEVPWAPGEADSPIPVSQTESYVYFTPEEAAFIESAVARLIPADELGPNRRHDPAIRSIQRDCPKRSNVRF